MIDISVKDSINISDAMKKLDETSQKCLVVVDSVGHLLGTLTDGDIRRSVLSNKSFSLSIKSSYNKNPIFLKENDYKHEEVLKLLKNNKLDLIPIVNNQNIFCNYVTWNELGKSSNITNKSLSGMQVVIMAGGEGTRLRPFTNILPKPLIPVEDKTIVELIIDKFTLRGCNDFFISTNYKKKILRSYFEEINHSYDLRFIDEDKPLGTAGSIKFAKKDLKKDFFVTNCDIIINANLSSIADFHKVEKNDITIVASVKKHVIPYGTCELNQDGSFSKLNEKPKFNFLINTGLYVLNKNVLSLIPKNKFFHMTDLIRKAKDKNNKVSVFPINEEDWIDVGQWGEYKNFINNISGNF